MFATMFFVPVLSLMFDTVFEQPLTWYSTGTAIRDSDGIVQQENEAMTIAFRVRNAFFCGTTYWGTIHEICFLHMPLILAGVICVGFSAKLGQLVMQLRRQCFVG